MAITQCTPTQAKADFLGGVFDLDTDVLKIALYTSSATLDATTTVYSSTNEVVGTNYVAGGNTITGAVIATSGTTAYFDCDDTQWAAATITARGAMIYDSSKSNKALVILDFGADKTSTDGNFDVIMPAATSSTALLRFA